MASITLKEAKIKPFGGYRRPAAVKVGDDSIGWKQSRSVAASNIKLEKTPLMRQVVHQPRTIRKTCMPPAQVKSIDFSGLVHYGRPSVDNQKHFQKLIQVKKGVWNEK